MRQALVRSENRRWWTLGAVALGLTVHPFEITFALNDIRLTTRHAENDLTSLFTAAHEGRHGVYEHGVAAELDRTPLASGCSSALHESQSRLWENVVGRSLPFWRWFYEYGLPVQQWGVSPHDGLYFVGVDWLHKRKSALFSGVGEDAGHVVEHLVRRRPS